MEDQQPKGKVMQIDVSGNGPLILDGPVHQQLPDGEIVRRDKKTALCRCGASNKKPFCDGSHVKINFKG